MCWKPFPTKQVKHNGAHKHMLKVHELIHENREAKNKVIAYIKHTIKKNNKIQKPNKPHNIKKVSINKVRLLR